MEAKIKMWVFMYARLHGKHHNLLDNETYLEIFDEISNVSGFKIDKIGYLLLHPDYHWLIYNNQPVIIIQADIILMISTCYELSPQNT